MADTTPTLEEWRRLYAAAARVKELAPWTWMMEDDIFGVQNPETDEIGFVSVMGNLGEHLAAALYKFLELEEDAEDEVEPQRLLEIPQLQASFEDREQLEKKDRDVIKQLGLKFRGAQAWPQFRSYEPGFFPWYLTGAEARFLACALEQVPEVAARFNDDDSLLWPEGENVLLVRAAREDNGGLVWEDKVVSVPPPEPEIIPLKMDLQALERLKQMPHSDREVEIDLILLPTPVGEKNERPFFPYLLMIVDGQSRMIVGNEMLKAQPSLEAMWGMVPVKVVHTLAQLGSVPGLVRVRSELLVGLLQQVSVEVGFQLKQSRAL